MISTNPELILEEMLSIDKGNIFLDYMAQRLRDKDYRGWHVSQHNRYGLREVMCILQEIQNVAGAEFFAIPPGDYKSDEILSSFFLRFEAIVGRINAKIGRGTTNSVKKNFFPDLDKMGFLLREIKEPVGNGKKILHGKLTKSAVDMLRAQSLIDRYKMFTDGVDKMFASKISALAEMIHLSDYAGEPIGFYEFMFILSDKNESVNKIELLGSYRRLKQHKRNKVIELAKRYAKPENFAGDKTAKRDFHNWKNQAQQIMTLLRTTVYFEVDLANESFRLNTGDKGFYSRPTARSDAPKRKYFSFHEVAKRDEFELHHIVPIASARNKAEAKRVDDYRNLIYLHRKKHRQISANGNKNVVLSIDPEDAVFWDMENRESVRAKNNKNALYARKQSKIKAMTNYNAGLLQDFFDFAKAGKLK